MEPQLETPVHTKVSLPSKEVLKQKLQKRATETLEFLQSIAHQSKTTEKTDQDAYVLFFRGKQAHERWENRRNYIKERLLQMGLQIKEVRTTHGKKPRVYFIITSPFDLLLKMAARNKWQKMTKQNLLKEFHLEQAEDYEGIENPETFFNQLERQGLTKLAIESCKVSPTDKILSKDFGPFKHHFFQPGISIVPLCLGLQIATHLFPLHNNTEKAELSKIWLRHDQFEKNSSVSDRLTVLAETLFSSRSIPFENIRSYFGEQTTFYFAWFNFYNKWLLFPAILGLLLQLQIWTQLGIFGEANAMLLYTLTVVIWGALFTQFWRRHSMDLALQWGVLDFKEKEQSRPAYRGELQKSEITGQYELVYPQWKSALKLGLSCAVFSVIIVVLFFFMIAFFRLRTRLNKEGWAWTAFLFSSVYSLVLNLISSGFQRLAVLMNQWENIRTESEYCDRLAIRIFIFECLNCYGSVIYLSIYLKDVDALRDYIFFFIVTRQFIGFFNKSVLSYAIDQWKFYRQRQRFMNNLRNTSGAPVVAKPGDDEDEEEDDEEDEQTESKEKDQENLGQYEVEAKLKTFDSIIQDHLQLIIQFGYLTIFAAVSPLTPFWALVCNLIEIKSQAFQICYLYQRPWSVQTNSIGILQTLTEVVVLLSVITNVAYLGFFTPHYKQIWSQGLHLLSYIEGEGIRTLPYGVEEQMLVMFIMEHVVLIIVVIVVQIVRTYTPSNWVLTEQKKHAHLQEQMIEALTSVKFHELSSTTAEKVVELRSLLSSVQGVGNDTVQRLTQPKETSSEQKNEEQTHHDCHETPKAKTE